MNKSGMPELLVPWQKKTYFKSQVFIRIHLTSSYLAYNSYVSITLENVHYFI